jgi:hypothetical protein
LTVIRNSDAVVRGVIITRSALARSRSLFGDRARFGSSRFRPARFLGITYFMAKSIKVKPKKRGRPATGKDPLVGFRASPTMRASVVRWAESQSDTPTLSEAIRRLVELGLTVKTAVRSTSKPDRRLRAQELAAKAIDKMGDPAAPPEEHAQRRRRLTKGPEEFQELRVDRPKAKTK